jgi:gliding motility-associated-like protein
MLSKVYAQAPVINSFSPAKAAIGSQVIINGSNFNPTAAGNIVFFGATRAKIISASNTSLTVEAPAGATFQPISVLNINTRLTGYSAYPFHVIFPSKQSITALDFDSRVDFATGETPSNIGIGDLDGDGKPDMVVVNRNVNTISIYRNIAISGIINASSFAPKFELSTGLTPIDVAINDIDGDGKPEILITNSSSNTVSVFRNTAIAGMLNAASFNTRVDLPTSATPTYIKVGDLDMDGKPDIAITYTNVNTILSVIKNISTPGFITNASFKPRIDLDTGNGFIALAITDLNYDNKPELIIADAVFDRVSIYENITNIDELTTASFGAKINFFTQKLPFSVNTGDMDGDGKTDLVISNFGETLLPGDPTQAYISVLLGNINSGSISTASFKPYKKFLAGHSPRSSAINDLDGDGKLDVVTTNYFDNELSIFHNKSTVGNVQFDNKVSLASGNKPQDIKIADIDGDGKPDIIATNSESNTVSIYRNNSNNEQTITFTPLQTVIYGAVDFSPGAISNNPGNPIIYTSSNPAVATIMPDGLIHVVGVGTTTITANQNATANVEAAAPKSQYLKVLPAPLNIKANNQSRYYGVANSTLTTIYTGLVNGDNITDLGIVYNISTPANINSLPGGYPIFATGDATSANYTITYTDAVLTINKLMQTITFDAVTDRGIGDADFILDATASSGLLVTYNSANSDIASIIGNTVHINKVGTVNITATQPGNDIYEPATAVVRSLKVTPLHVTILSNTITPNGDGINDTWIVQGLDYDVSGTVSIFNRNGGLVFQSRGYPIPFNGTRNGKKLPAGVYYYVINFSDRRTSLSGNLTILY